MPGVIVNGAEDVIPGLRCTSWHDDPALRLRIGEDGTRRSPGTWVRAVVLHTTRGIPGGADRRPQQILFGLGPSTDIARKTNRWWSTNGQCAGAHIVVDHDGSVACLADLVLEQTYHAGSVNAHTVGIELAQGANGELWAGQLEAAVILIDWLTARLEIQRQIPDTYRGPISRIRAGARNIVGVYGHRDQTAMRGIGDPGDAIFDLLDAAGYERFDFSTDADLAAWSRRQRVLGVTPDGVPGRATVAAIRGFQTARGLAATGIADAATRALLDPGSE